MRKQDYIISGILHILLFALIVIFSSARSSANQFSPDDVVVVQAYDGLPPGLGSSQPEPVAEEPEPKLTELPEAAADDFVEERPIQLASIEKPAEIAVKEIKEKKPKSEAENKSKPTSEQKKPSDGESKTKVGEGEVTTSIGIGGEPGGLGKIDFPYDIAHAAQMIDRNWDNPVQSQRTLRCVIYFQIDRQGRIRGAVVEESSGDDRFDTYALSAVLRTGELPPLPVAYRYDVLGFHLEFEATP